MNSVVYRTHRAVTGPMSFKKSRRFCRKIVIPGFWGTWLYQSTLFDLANTVLAKKSCVETICMNSGGYRSHRAVTGPMSFKKSRRFCRKIVIPGFWGTWLYQSTLFDLANTVLAKKSFVETICMNSGGYRSHRAVTGPMSFKKLRSFVGKSCSRVFGAPGSIEALYLTLQTLFWLKKSCVETICKISEGCKNHRAVTGPMSFKKSRRFVGKSCCRVFGAPGYIKALYLTLQTLFWLLKVL